MNTIEVTYTKYNDEEISLELPCKMEVCNNCQGTGYHLNESMRYHGYSQEEFMEDFDDYDREQYCKRGGIYDVPCETCNGRNVIPVINEAAISSNMMDEYMAYKNWKEEDDRMEAAYQAECRMERMLGC